jgi:hypothetical protein
MLFLSSFFSTTTPRPPKTQDLRVAHIIALALKRIRITADWHCIISIEELELNRESSQKCRTVVLHVPIHEDSQYPIRSRIMDTNEDVSKGSRPMRGSSYWV